MTPQEGNVDLSWASRTVRLAESVAVGLREEDIQRVIGAVVVEGLDRDARRCIVHEIAVSDSYDVRMSLADLAVEMAARGDDLAYEISSTLADDPSELVRSEANFVSKLLAITSST